MQLSQQGQRRRSTSKEAKLASTREGEENITTENEHHRGQGKMVSPSVGRPCRTSPSCPGTPMGSGTSGSGGSVLRRWGPVPRSQLISRENFINAFYKCPGLLYILLNMVPDRGTALGHFGLSSFFWLSVGIAWRSPPHCILNAGRKKKFRSTVWKY